MKTNQKYPQTIVTRVPAVFTVGTLFLLICILILISCGKRVDPPTALLSKAEMAVKQAQENNGLHAAPLEIRLAEESLQKAQESLQKREYKEARRYAELAMANSELAEAKAASEKSKKNLDETKESLDALSKEVNKNNTSK